MFESLENRVMFDNTGVPPVPIGISLADGVLRIKGAATHDTGVVSFSFVSQKLTATLDRWQMADTEYGPLPVEWPTVVKQFDPAQVQSIMFYGMDGNDGFSNNTWIKSTAFGGAGNDVLKGGTGNDSLRGGDGHDDLFGREGNDSVWGDAGSDLLVGGAGSDLLMAKDGIGGNDDVYGNNQDGTGGANATDVAHIDKEVLYGFFPAFDFVTGCEQVEDD
jgi:Ca2+-binding RTX toxin-like protein